MTSQSNQIFAVSEKKYIPTKKNHAKSWTKNWLKGKKIVFPALSLSFLNDIHINTKIHTITDKSRFVDHAAKGYSLLKGSAHVISLVTSFIGLQSFQLRNGFFCPCPQHLLIYNSSELTNFSNIPIILPAHFEYFQEMRGNKRSFNISFCC